MIFDRRSVLKALAVAPAFFARSTLVEALGRQNDQPGDNMVHIYLVGLFLMEFQNADLVLATPQYHHHKYFEWDGKSSVTELAEYINLWDRVKPGSIYEFSPQNLKFKSDLISNGYLLHPESPSKYKHRCTIVLPRPYAISAEFPRPVADFDPEQTSKIGAAIKKEAADAGVECLGSVTHLQYEPADKIDPFTKAYLVLHYPLKRATVNGALRAARKVCGQAFDLQMHTVNTVSHAGGPPPQQSCPGPDQALKTRTLDFKNLPVIPGVKEDVDIASCPQFGMHQ
jgi:hypothetical protein